MIDFAAIRVALTEIPTDHDASGVHRPTVDQIFTPNQHANALDPNTPIVVGARGTGKSFWAGVLGQVETREATAAAYPNLGLDKLLVKPGYSGFAQDGAPSARIINGLLLPHRDEAERASGMWQAVVIRSAQSALVPTEDEPASLREVMDRYADPEDAENELRSLDRQFTALDKTLLVTFDALDTLSRDWVRSSILVDALFEVIWGLRVRRSIRAKVFIRPEQLNDEALRFIELPKLRSGRVELEWGQVDLYGLLYWRLYEMTKQVSAPSAFRLLVEDCGISTPSEATQKRRGWPLLADPKAQKNVMSRLAGLYMGRTNRKGNTYDWPYNHLSDSAGKVTPRSFLTLFVEASKSGPVPDQRVITAEGIRQGLREASKVRVDQLVVEYKWVKRALAPLAGVVVPCDQSAIFERWEKSNTIKVILEASVDDQDGFLPPFPVPSKGNQFELLADAMQRIGVLAVREDHRIDIPDLFRVAALMLKKGGISPMTKD